MKIIIDERESQLHAELLRLESNKTVSIIHKKVLPLGDVIITTNTDEPLFIVERKSMNDLLASIKDGRYVEQSYRLQHSDEFTADRVIYIIEGMFSQIKNPTEKKSIYSAMVSLEYFKGFHVERTYSVVETAEYLWNTVDKLQRDIDKGKVLYSSFRKTVGKEVDNETGEDTNPGEDTKPGEEEIKPGEEETKLEQKPQHNNYCTVVKKVKKENITRENMGEIILCQIPGISSTTAIAIMENMNHSISHMLSVLEKTPEQIASIMLGKKKVGDKLVEKMKHYMLS